MATKAKVNAPDNDAAKGRSIKAPKRRFWKRQDKRFRARRKLPNVFRLSAQATRLVFRHWKLIGGIVLLYGVLNLILVRGINGGLDVGSLKSQADTLFHGLSGKINAGFQIFGLLVSHSNNVANNQTSAYQTILLVIISLALIWAYRQVLAGQVIRIRDAFYNGMQQLIPVILVLLVVFLQLIPMLLGLWLYAALTSYNIATTGLEQLGTGIVSLALVSVSIYLVCSSIFALYIATLPGMTPMQALGTAQELVRYRRWPLIRKLLYLPLALLIVGAVIMLPLILTIPVLAQWVFFFLNMFVVAIIHAYMYTLYRELIDE